LQLIPEAECAARLVVAAACPEATADRLIQQPLVHQRIEGVVRRAHLHGAERAIPDRVDAVERDECVVHATVTRDEPTRMIAIGALPQEEQQPTTLSPPKRAANVQCRTRIQARADAP